MRPREAMLTFSLRLVANLKEQDFWQISSLHTATSCVRAHAACPSDTRWLDQHSLKMVSRLDHV
jgi:hypothetical protein